MAVRRIAVSGFRGILSPLELRLHRGSQCVSAVVFGRNGTGKSSITDAWEWFQFGEVAHLQKEGAQHSAYAHRESRPGQSYVEVDFESSALGSVRLVFDPDRVRTPQADGDISAFRSKAAFPCQLRYQDLTRFVYLTKTARYDALAGIMGFAPQVEYHKAVRRVERKLQEEVTRLSRVAHERRGSYLAHTGAGSTAESEFALSVSQRLARHGLTPVTDMAEARERIGELRTRVEGDPISTELTELVELQRILADSEGLWDMISSLEAFAKELGAFKEKEEAVSQLLLMELYEHGERVLLERTQLPEPTDVCPLCGQLYEGDLLLHVQTELDSLRTVKAARDSLEAERRRLVAACDRIAAFAANLARAEGKRTTRSGDAPSRAMAKLLKVTGSARGDLELLLPQLEQRPEKVTLAQLGQIMSAASQWNRSRDRLCQWHLEARDAIGNRVQQLQEDSGRAGLVDDYDWARKALDEYAAVRVAEQTLTRVGRTAGLYGQVVDRFATACLDDVETRFDRISGRVATYFGILEQMTPDLQKPALRLVADQDRAAVLEVEFHGELIAPAYRYLSESQLNSFGLAVFLASAREFNDSFRFLILDDIVNSFDGYKRPQVISLIREEFSDYQVILLTHDDLWREQLCRSLPHWTRVHFQRWEYASGPVAVEALTSLETVSRLLREDNPIAAGGVLGPLMEREIQEVCEATGAHVPYRRSNEYYLPELLQRLRARLKDKLGSQHSVVSSVARLEENIGFRNFCAHWKNPASQITPEEVELVVDLWKRLTGQFRCSRPECRGLVTYDGATRGFACACGAATIRRNQ